MSNGDSRLYDNPSSKAARVRSPGLHFNIETESFEFHAPTNVTGDPTRVDVTELFSKGPTKYLRAFPDVDDDTLDVYTWIV